MRHQIARLKVVNKNKLLHYYLMIDQKPYQDGHVCMPKNVLNNIDILKNFFKKSFKE